MDHPIQVASSSLFSGGSRIAQVGRNLSKLSYALPVSRPNFIDLKTID
jgi:hypothetical protein